MERSLRLLLQEKLEKKAGRESGAAGGIKRKKEALYICQGKLKEEKGGKKSGPR